MAVGFKLIDATELASLLQGRERFALFDVRDEGIFARSHLLYANPLPLSDLETRLFRLVPDAGTLLVLTSDEGDGLVERAIEQCTTLGYRNLRVLDGGNAAWLRAGYKLFKGIHVPSKAFGEVVDDHYRTPTIGPADLYALLEEQRPGQPRVHLYDCRPPHEFHRMSLPGARNCPGVDLLSRLPALVDPDDTVVINCAGRTRGILGAQSLINARLPGRVMTLKNGTMGLHLAGFPLESGRTDLVESVEPKRLDDMRERMADLRQEFDIPVLSLQSWQEVTDSGALLLDVRPPWEYSTGHFPGARNAPGGQLLQATDFYVAVRNAPIVLMDDDGIRASITASWLAQMGIPFVSVLDHRDIQGLLGKTGVESWVPVKQVPPLARITYQALQQDLNQGQTLLLDIRSSDDYYKAHLPEARFVIRSRFPGSVPRLPRRASITLIANDPVTAAFAARELEASYGAPLRLLEGGNEAWIQAGLPVESGLGGAIDPPEDMWHIPSSPLGGLESAMRDYISWEVGLTSQIMDEPGYRFSVGSR